MTSTRSFCGVSLVDSQLVQASLKLAKESHDEVSFNHVYRSWVFGALLASKIPTFAEAEIDFEVHAASALLHDLAWHCDSPFSTPDKRFEVDGANAARTFLDQAAPHFAPRQRQLVWDSIALHTTPSIAQHKEPEVALCAMGVFADFLGPRFPGGLISKDEYNSVIKELPLCDFKESVKKILCGLCEKKPQTTYDNFVRDFGERFVEGYTAENAVDMLMVTIES
ncbi:hypothetical protein BGW36DRAFT_401839 [Talaromyces proteolyticus]|uniref:HD domain-containing protein n=1 Tax=Talaromyces proteolyticus TaxID=1131652 RepID=A0AAD4KJ36_9EURO|nr:uncharacterized protein BGW36DRAFT_401839 [Talaromyces proteolyticus]KAH8689483.1 hypothetical protein BGW36DRAFT_401839 [Talaromyces proteolyticus]